MIAYYLMFFVIFLIIVFALISDTISGSFNLGALLFIFVLAFIVMLMITYNIGTQCCI